MHPVTSNRNRDMTESSDGVELNANCDVTESSDVTECDIQLVNGNQISYNSDDDDRLSLASSLSEKDMGVVEERASSSLSISSSKGSRIPRLNRSNSLRERPQRLSLDHCESSRNIGSHAAKQIQKNSPPFGLFRSSSFATTRGMREFTHGISDRSSIPATPELKRKFPAYNTSYVSPYSKKSIAAERKSQNVSILPSPREKDPHFYYSPQVNRRTSMPPMSHTSSSHYSSHAASESSGKIDGSPDDDEDDASEKSFGSVCSAHSCDLGSGLKKVSRGDFWSVDRRPRNILHCSHAHEHDPDDYLTPTQRAARKIRELQGELKKARREIAEKDNKISVLTRELVELRLNKAEIYGEHVESLEAKRKAKSNNEKGETKTSLPRRTSSPPLEFLRPLTPTSDDCDQELKSISRGKKYKGAKEPLHKKDSQNSAVSSRNSPATASVGGDSDSGDLIRSLADSGHYDDLPSPCLSSRDSMDAGIPSLRKIISSICASEGERDTAMVWASVCAAEEGIKAEWSRRLEELKSNHMEEYHELKERHNDKVEMLLNKLSDANLKYFEIRPQYDKAQEKMRHSEKEILKLNDELRESEIRHQKVYLQMYLKGQQSARLEEDDKFLKRDGSFHSKDGRKSTVKDNSELDGNAQKMVFSLMKQLAQSENEIEKLKTSHCQESSRSGRRTTYGNRREEIDPEITLQFLKSAIYYFLTDKENSQGHLRAIESILGYTSIERGTINKNFRI